MLGYMLLDLMKGNLYLMSDVNSKNAADVDVCNICGDSVVPGSGKWVNRIPCLDTPEERIESGRDYPYGDFICAECAYVDPEEMMQ